MTQIDTAFLASNVRPVSEGQFKTSVKQFIRFVIVGGINTLVDLIILNIATLTTGVTDGAGYAIQKGLSFFVAVICSYFLNKQWTFKDQSEEASGKKFSQFFAVSLGGGIINTTIATIMVTYAKPVLNPALNLPFLTDQVWVSIGALCGTAVALIWNFVGYKFMVFKK